MPKLTDMQICAWIKAGARTRLTPYNGAENMTIEKSRFNSEATPQSNTVQKDIFTVTDNDISVIRFEGKKVRIVNCDGNPWFIAKDVCEVLELSNHSMTIAALDDDEKGVSLTYTPGGNQNMRTVSESGFCKLIARSRKATTAGTFAHRFTNWVFREVTHAVLSKRKYMVLQLSDS